ncbi:MAG: PAS domain S-box protein [Nitrospirae bacterium]|nr:PAS domain S-box protein [Nitrospirota bacterium]
MLQRTQYSFSHAWLNGLIAVVILGMLLAGGLGLRLLEDRLVVDAGEGLALVAELIANELDQALTARRQELLFLAGMGQSKITDRKALSAHLALMKHSLPSYQWIGLIDGGGRVIVATDDATIGQDVSREAWFAGLMGGKGIVVQDVHPDVLVQGIDAVGFAAPLTLADSASSSGSQGIVATRIGVRPLEEIVARAAHPLKGKSAYQGKVEHQVLRRQGDVFIDSDLDHKGNVNLRAADLPSVKRALSGERGFVEEEHARRHVAVITGYAGLPETAESPGLEWIVLARVDRGAVLASIQGELLKAGMWGAIVVAPVLLTLVWVSRRLQREHRTSDANLKFVQSTLDSLATHVAIVDERGTILAVNQAWRGFAGENGLNDPTFGLGRSYLEVCDTASGAWSEEAARVSGAIRAIIRSEHSSAFIDYPCHSPDAKRWFRLSLSRFQTGNDVRVVVSHQNITELVERDRRQAAEHAVTTLLLESNSLDRIANVVLGTICQTLDWGLGIMWRVDPSTDRLRCSEVWADDPDQYVAFIERTRQSRFALGVGLPGRVWKSHAVEWIADVMRDTNFPRAPYALQSGLHAAFAFPIMCGEQVFGVMEFFTTALRPPDQLLLDMFGSVVGQVAQCLVRQQAEIARRSSEAKLAGILELAEEAIISVDDAQRIALFNGGAARAFGYAPEEVLGQPLGKLLPTRFVEDHARRVREFGESLDSTRWMGGRREIIGLRKNGEEFPAEGSISKLTIDGRDTYTAILRDISERKLVEHQLHESEERFALAVEGAEQGVWEWNARTNKAYLSPRWKNMLGYEEWEIENQFSAWERLIHPDDLARAVRYVHDYMEGRFSEYVLEHRLRHKDGTYRWILSRAASLKDEDGKPYRIAGANVDITLQRQQEQDLKTHASQQAAIAALGRQALVMADPSTFMDEAVALIAGTLDVRFCKILELQPDRQSLILRAGVGWNEGLVGQAVVGAGVDSQAGYTLQIGRSVIVDDLRTETRFSGPPLLHDHHIVSGASVVIQAQNQPFGVLGVHTDRRRVFSDDDVRFLEATAGILGMALERAQTRADLRLKKEQAEVSAREKARILASVQAFFISVSRDGTVNEWTGQSESLLGIDVSEAIGRPFTDLPIDWNWAEIQDAMSRASEMFMGEDVTERLGLERELAQAQKLESIGQLAAGIAHEINTPTQFVGDNTRFVSDSFQQLTDMLGRFHDLLNAARVGAVPESMVREIEEAGKAADLEYLAQEVPKALAQSIEGIDRIAHIVRAMKDFAHPDRGEKTLVDLGKAIESTATVSRNEWKYVADLVTDVEPGLPPVSCRPGEMNQVLLNLIVNAAHAIGDVVAQQGGKGTITVRAHRTGEWVDIQVVDTGTGIPESIRDKIFDPFFTTKEVGKGTGQGLAIARSVIVEKHGGALTCESTVGKGTTFVIRLPICDQSANGEAGRQAPSVTPAASPATGG